MSLEREQALWNDLSEYPDTVALEITRSYGPRFLLTTHRHYSDANSSVLNTGLDHRP